MVIQLYDDHIAAYLTRNGAHISCFCWFVRDMETRRILLLLQLGAQVESESKSLLHDDQTTSFVLFSALHCVAARNPIVNLATN
jgi:hypothetical protein